MSKGRVEFKIDKQNAVTSPVMDLCGAFYIL